MQAINTYSVEKTMYKVEIHSERSLLRLVIKASSERKQNEAISVSANNSDKSN